MKDLEIPVEVNHLEYWNELLNRCTDWCYNRRDVIDKSEHEGAFELAVTQAVKARLSIGDVQIENDSKLALPKAHAQNVASLSEPFGKWSTIKSVKDTWKKDGRGQKRADTRERTLFVKSIYMAAIDLSETNPDSFLTDLIRDIETGTDNMGLPLPSHPLREFKVPEL